MQKLNDLLKQPVLTASGQKIGKVVDLVLNQHATKLLGIIVTDGKDPQVLPFADITSIGHDAVIVESEQKIVAASTHDEINQALQPKLKLQGKSIISAGGNQLGTLTDLLFDPQNGEVQGYEVNPGMREAASSGPLFVPPSEATAVSEKTVIVSSTAESQMQPEQDVPGAPPVTPPKQRVQGFMAGIKQRIDGLKQRASSAKQAKDEQKMLGKPVTRTILDKQDQVILQSGETITHTALSQAKEAGVIDILKQSI